MMHHTEPQTQLFMVFALWRCTFKPTESVFKEFIVALEGGEFSLDTLKDPSVTVRSAVCTWQEVDEKIASGKVEVVKDTEV